MAVSLINKISPFPFMKTNLNKIISVSIVLGFLNLIRSAKAVSFNGSFGDPMIAYTVELKTTIVDTVHLISGILILVAFLPRILL